jgi:hypothetical protein
VNHVKAFDLVAVAQTHAIFAKLEPALTHQELAI